MNISPALLPEETFSPLKPVKVSSQDSNNDSAEKVIAWEDIKIDREAKVLLKQRGMGQHIPGDTIAHLEFFYNTLNMEHSNNTENPFLHPENYPALNF